MKKIIFLLLLLPSIVFSQSNGLVINITASGSIGTAANTVDGLNEFKLNPNASGYTVSVPSLSNPNTTQLKKATFQNITSFSITLTPGGLLNPGAGCLLQWSGTQWTVMSVTDVVTSSGNAASATKLATARTITQTGDVSCTSTPFDGTANITNNALVTRINGTSLAGLSTGLLKNTTTTGVPSIAAEGVGGDYISSTTGDGRYSYGLTRTTDKTANYTAVVGDLIPCNTTSGSFTITLPAAPANNSRVLAKHIIQGGTNTVSVVTSGSDVFNKSGGGTTVTLKLVDQGYSFQYSTTGAVWTVTACDYALSTLCQAPLTAYGIDTAANPIISTNQILQGLQIAQREIDVSTKTNALNNALKAGISADVLVLGNSTCAGTTTWPYRLLQRIAAKYTNYNVKYSVWDPTNTVYLAPVWLQQPGGERYLNCTGVSPSGARLVNGSMPAIAGDIDVRIKVNATNYSNGASQALVGKYQAGSGTSAWRLYLGATGTLNFLWTTDGTTGTQIVKTSTVTLPSVGISNGTDLWVRATLQVNNGSSQNVVKFYYGSDNVTYTQLGTTITTAGVTSIDITNTAIYEVGCTGSVSSIYAGKIYNVEIRNGIAGFITNPYSIETWFKYANSTYGGYPTLNMFIGGHSGGTISTMIDPTRIKTMIPYDNYSVVIFSQGHNDGIINDTYLANYDTWYAQLKARIKIGQFFFMTENPETSGSTFYTEQPYRQTQLLQWAVNNNIKVFDMEKAFYYCPNYTQMINADGLHPNTGFGYPFEADYLFYQLFNY